MRKSTLFVLVAVLAIILIAWAMNRPQVVSDPIPKSPEELQAITPSVTFTNDADESVLVAFPEGKAVFTGLGYTDEELMQALSASGARYENAEGLELWNNGDTVTISKDGEVLFTGRAYEGDMEASIVGATWVWRQSVVGGDAIVAPQAADAFTLIFGEDGTVLGTTDCNDFSGSYTYTDGIISFGPLVMTRMFCEGSEEMMFTNALTEGPLMVSFERDSLVLQFSEVTSMIFERLQ